MFESAMHGGLPVRAFLACVALRAVSFAQRRNDGLEIGTLGLGDYLDSPAGWRVGGVVDQLVHLRHQFGHKHSPNTAQTQPKRARQSAQRIEQRDVDPMHAVRHGMRRRRWWKRAKKKKNIR